MSTLAQPGAGREELVLDLANTINPSPAVPLDTLKGWRRENLLATARKALAWFERRIGGLLLREAELRAEIAALIAERDALKAELAAERARAEQLQDRIDGQSEALQRIVQWADAYPTDIFTPPDYPAIHKTLTANGFVPGHTLDGISADCMRRATEGMGGIARAALATPTPTSEGQADAQQP